MDNVTRQNYAEALAALASMTSRSKQAQAKFAPGTAQHTLQKNRLHALAVATALVTDAQAGRSAGQEFNQAELQAAQAPLASLISKSEKALQKLKQGTWQHTMLDKNLAALHLAAPLLQKAPGDKADG